MGAGRDQGSPAETLEYLGHTVRAAAQLASEIVKEPLLARLIKVFHLMPVADRTVVLEAIERDVQARLLSLATEKVTGQATHPNPNARLYVRTHGAEATRGDLERREMFQATVRMARVAPLLMVPEIHAEWVDATSEALRSVSPEERSVIETLIRDVLGMIAQCAPATPEDRRRRGEG